MALAFLKLLENFVKINNKYFKVVPTNYSSPDILYYSPNDLLDISNEEETSGLSLTTSKAVQNNLGFNSFIVAN